MTKKAENVVDDIYGLLSDVINGETKELSPEIMADFGTRVAFKLEKALTARAEGRKPKTLYMSEYGRPCRRQLWYEIRGEFDKEKLRPENLIKFLYGDLIEEIVLVLAKLAGHEVTDEQKVCEIELPYGWKLRGRLDAKIDGELVDAKSASTFAFKKFKDGTLADDDPFGYIPQLEAYAESEGVKEGEDISFLVVDKTLGHMTRMAVPYAPKNKEDLEKFREELVEDMERTMPPARNFGDILEGKSGNRKLPVTCSYCGYKEECWKDANDGAGLRTFAYTRGPVFMTKVVRKPNVPEIKKEE